MADESTRSNPERASALRVCAAELLAWLSHRLVPAGNGIGRVLPQCDCGTFQELANDIRRNYHFKTGPAYPHDDLDDGYSALAEAGKIDDSADSLFLAFHNPGATTPIAPDIVSDGVQCERVVSALKRMAGTQQAVSQPAAPQATDAKGDAPARDDASVEQRALAVLANNPSWSNKQIADAVGTNPKYLSSKKNCPKFIAARNLLKSRAPALDSKSKDGRIDAVGDGDRDFDEMDRNSR